MNLRMVAVLTALSTLLLAAPLMAQNATPAAPAPSLPAPLNVPGVGAIPNIPGVNLMPDVKEKPEDLLHKAITAYEAGQMKDSLKLIEDAQDGIRVKHAELYAKLLPSLPAGGWTIADPDPSKTVVTFSTRVAGGLNVINRTFAGNGHKVTITYIADSSTIALVSPLLSAFAPLVIGPNGSFDSVKGNPAMYLESKPDEVRHRPASHTIIVMMPDTIVAVTSQTLPKETLMQFASTVDFDQLKAIK